ncbi:tetracycline resistance ribosomal protection protein Tet(M) [Oceanobacillus oncorhynchi subsp. incaldanensis]|uniref:TetM/TetW/TetO/TetS family tetracycline resistance ribosomal protection protein n=1 Tax=Oceanobacillus oncorhynchi TaxID=545501 RepID=UPI001B02E3E0|nr:TetM/TetW/TetO/TetS family tetracycline resistance ribosomal protection protein [Oceanobacillus oncorhynchi]GIO18470.1 tetracycline resistance ribosomal protection protein Tet(M) [Oceanobacillus oncorhynchi subsp. incaldanensis]HIS29515.1 TetM/TetW/TetO/TetS family tetracycline resistance ribosomal protection protein [Candidatus Avamphibacillus intestinigallinarum]
MKIINIGILAHVDAGKTTLAESLLYNSGAIAELGSVDSGTTKTDTMFLERQRGITIQTAITSFQWKDIKVNIVDTPGHMDFLAEVYRSLSVLDGAILLVSAKDGVQAQTRILFHALRKMGIPTIFFINKIDQNGINLSAVYQNIKEKLSEEIIIKQNVNLLPNTSVMNFTESEQWEAVIAGSDYLLEKYTLGKPLETLELEQEENRRFQNCSLYPIYHGSAKNNVGIEQLIEVITNKFFSSTYRNQDELCGNVFKVEYSNEGQRLVYVRLYSGVLHLRDSVRISEKEKIRITEMYTSESGELCKINKAYSGEIVILKNEFLKLNSVLGNTEQLPRREIPENPLPLLQTTIEPCKPEQRGILLDALFEISDSDPLLQYYVDSTTHEIVLSFLGKVQMEVICALIQEKYHVDIETKEPTVIYMERPLKKAEYTINIEVPPNPFWASIGLSVTPLPLGSGVQYESLVSLGYLNQSFQNAVMEGIRYGCEQGLYGWNVTDCKICFKYGLYYSPVSTPADFRMLAPIVLEQALRKSGTELLEPYLSFKIYVPQEYLSRAYNDASKYCANILNTKLKSDEVILIGEIPARCIQEYRNNLTFFTNGRSVCLTELKGYQVTTIKSAYQPRRPNSRIDKVRYMFNKIN